MEREEKRKGERCREKRRKGERWREKRRERRGR